MVVEFVIGTIVDDNVIPLAFRRNFVPSAVVIIYVFCGVLLLLSGEGVLDAEDAGLLRTTIAVGRLRLFKTVLGLSITFIGTPLVFGLVLELLLAFLTTLFGTGTIAEGADIRRRLRPLLVTYSAVTGSSIITSDSMDGSAVTPILERFVAFRIANLNQKITGIKKMISLQVFDF